MPSDYGLRANDHEVVLPARPEPRERDPEPAIERGKPGTLAILSIDRELLAQGKLDDGLILTTSEEAERATKQ
jgi:hypothetical protein